MSNGNAANLAERKTCEACGQEKPIDEFYMRFRDGDPTGRMNVCRDCHKLRVKARTAERKAEQRAEKAQNRPR